jgi:hypothetical protein
MFLEAPPKCQFVSRQANRGGAGAEKAAIGFLDPSAARGQDIVKFWSDDQCKIGLPGQLAKNRFFLLRFDPPKLLSGQLELPAPIKNAAFFHPRKARKVLDEPGEHGPTFRPQRIGEGKLGAAYGISELVDENTHSRSEIKGSI